MALPWLAAFFGELILKEGTKTGVAKLLESDLAENLTDALKDWAKNLPTEYAGFEPSYLSDVAYGHKGVAKGSLGPQNTALADEIGHLGIPRVELWYRALEERRSEAGALLRENPESQAAAGRNAFYLAEAGEVAHLLKAAAERMRDVCKKDKVLVPAATYEGVEAVLAFLKEQAEQRKLAPEPRQGHGRKPWALEHFVRGAVKHLAAADPVVQAGDWVVATFEPQPSGGWKDPYARIEGLWHRNDRTIAPFSGKRIRSVLRSGKSVQAESTGLCIPSYQVDVEWREETLVHDPFWGDIKRVVVERFLKLCLGKQMICRIVYVGTRRGNTIFHLYSADYDGYLQEKWVYYKGLEAVLAINSLYKAQFARAELRKVIAEKLGAKDGVRKALPARFSHDLARVKIEEADVELVLQGLMQRYRAYRAATKERKTAPH